MVLKLEKMANKSTLRKILLRDGKIYCIIFNKLSQPSWLILYNIQWRKS